ncbi:MAG: peroxidase-related enzyme [Proteobacteria bacterium]|nr:peroxidase-related enzyme [Pseudomonadota bacterium]
MSFIHEIEPDEATGKLRVVYDALERSRGKVANILKVHSLRPSALQAHLTLYLDLLFASGGLSRRQRELLAVVVSRENACGYCVAHHREALARYIADTQLLDAIAQGCDASTLDAADRALCEHAVKLTRSPDRMEAQDVAALRTAGFDDADILLITLIVAYFNFVNRVALGLGVTFDAEEVAGYRG